MPDDSAVVEDLLDSVTAYVPCPLAKYALPRMHVGHRGDELVIKKIVPYSMEEKLWGEM